MARASVGATAASAGTSSEITDAARLAELIGEPAPKIRDKARPAPQPADVAHIAASPFVVLAEEAYFPCAKAFQRSRLWRPESWRPDAGPSRREVARAFWASGRADEGQVEQ